MYGSSEEVKYEGGHFVNISLPKTVSLKLNTRQLSSVEVEQLVRDSPPLWYTSWKFETSQRYMATGVDTLANVMFDRYENDFSLKR